MEGTRSIVSSLPHGLAGINGPWATRLFSALSGYHLADVLGLLGGEYPHPTVVKEPRYWNAKFLQVFLFLHCLFNIEFASKFYENLGDWVKLVADLDATLKRENTSLDPSPAPGLVHIQLMRCLSRIEASHKRQKITMNWLAAAMHIAFLNSRQCGGYLRELPESAAVLAEL